MWLTAAEWCQDHLVVVRDAGDWLEYLAWAGEECVWRVLPSSPAEWWTILAGSVSA
jgi:hypothetical protein